MRGIVERLDMIYWYWESFKENYFTHVATLWNSLFDRISKRREECLEMWLQSRPNVVGTLELYRVSLFPPNQKYRVFSNKRAKITWLSTLIVGGGENMLRVPTLWSGIVDTPFMLDISSQSKLKLQRNKIRSQTLTVLTLLSLDVNGKVSFWDLPIKTSFSVDKT